MDSITSQQDKQSEEALILLRRAKAYIIHIKRGYDESETVEQIFEDERLVRLRKSLFLECERLSQFPNFRREALDLFWSYCCYKPITYFKNSLNKEEEEAEEFPSLSTSKMLKTFISENISRISSLLSKLPDSKFSLLIWLGDLYRYSFIYCGKNKKDFTMSEQCYVNAALCHLNSGRPYNQLALLNLKIDPNHAFFLFLRSLTQHQQMDKNMDNVQANINLLDNNEGKDVTKFVLNSDWKLMLKFVNIVAFEFSRLKFDEARKEMDKLFDSLKSNFQAFLKHVNACTLAVAFAFRNQPTDEHFRYIASFTCQKLIYILEEGRRIYAAHENEDDLDRRRRKKESSSSSSTDSENEENEKEEDAQPKDKQKNIKLFKSVWHSAIIVAEFIDNCAEQFLKRKLSVSLKLQYQNILKTFIELLNDLITSISPLMEAEEKFKSTEKRALVNWNMYKIDENEDNSSFSVVLVHYIRAIISGEFAGIIFDKYFKLSCSNIGEKERKTMEGISRMHSAHVSKINETLSKIPVYILPDHHVLLERLSLLDQLCHTVKQNTVITRSVLAKLDKLKKDSANAREAIRWIQASVSDHKITLFHQVKSATNLFGEIKEFLEEKKLLDKQTLFLSILTSDGSEKDLKIVTEVELAKFPGLNFKFYFLNFKQLVLNELNIFRRELLKLIFSRERVEWGKQTRVKYFCFFFTFLFFNLFKLLL